MFLTKVRSWEMPLFIAYILLLLASNIVSDFVVGPYIMHHFSSPYLGDLISPIWGIIFWIIPSFVYIASVNRCNPFAYLKLTTNPGRGLLWILVGILWFVLALVLSQSTIDQ